MSLTFKNYPTPLKRMIREHRDDFIIEWYEEVRACVIAEYLGVSVDDVYSRAYRLGLSRVREREPEITNQDIWHMKVLAEELEVREIAFKFNITQKLCRECISKDVKPMIL